jgi:hypothetical protein
MNEKNLELLKKLLAESSKRVESHLKLKSKDIINKLINKIHKQDEKS